ncbi:unnamed protein product [Hymenolepis diminuta]|uniref:KH domain-containing protein n=3 Tax=Hymenolepis diminuta TaxID=6216 RepID=A0A0R3SYH6_HYMDI|nr:unnamed protein product [Hymenolepis diminuta]
MVRTSKLMDEERTSSSTGPTIQSNTVASARIILSVQEGNLQEAAPSKETQHNIVVGTNGTSLEGEILIASTQNPVSATSIIAPDRICDDDLTSTLVDDRANEESTVVAPEISSENNKSVNPDGGPKAYFGQGMFGIPEYNIEEIEPLLHNGVLLPRVNIPPDLLFSAEDPNVYKRSINIPIKMLGLFRGKNGKNISYLKEKYQAKIRTTFSDPNSTSIGLEVSCPLEFKEEVASWILERIRLRPSTTTIGNPSRLLRTPPLGELTRVFIRSSYSRKHLFVTIADEKYREFLEMEREMTADYSNNFTAKSRLYEPVYATSIAVLKTGTVYSRVCILSVVDGNPKYAICFLLDHGKFVIVPISDLRKIKTRYMRTPFQAVSVMWAHAQSPFVDASDNNFLMRYFNNTSLYVFPVRNETCCRSDVIFFNRIDGPKRGSQYLYQDILVQATNEGQCCLAGKVINLDEQFELNGSERAYYFCPYSAVYNDLVFYRMPNGGVVRASDVPEPRPLPKSENKHQHQQDQLMNKQRQQGRQSTNQRRRNNRAPDDGTATTANGRPNNDHNPQHGGNRCKYVPNGGYHSRHNHRHPRPNNEQRQ